MLGEAGLHNQKRCTTTWWLHYEFTKRFPQASAAWGSSLIQDENIITSGGPLSWVDISLRIIRSLSGNAAANFAVVNTVPASQEMYIPQVHLKAIDPFLVAAEDKIRKSLS